MLNLLFLNGLTYAALLFVMASGLTLAFGLMRIVNLSHGAYYLVGGYLGLTAFRITGSWPLALLAGGLSIAAIACLIERALLVWVRGKELPESLLTLAVAMILGDAAVAVWGGNPLNLQPPALLTPRLHVLGVVYPGFRVFVLIFGVLVGIGLWLLLMRTSLGMAVRAGVDDRETTAALGINVGRTMTAVFMLAGLLAGFAGVIGGSYWALAPGEDFQALALSLVTIVIGGMGSLIGAAVGALITAMTLSFATAYFPDFSLFFVFAPMALVLAVRPQGLFGR
ncbi:MAG: branched-chain amino acid ABC transporter permease [Armatimonadetes bacterium]|nr:branched-chain amino acid ABC transporter permease [Armatimonadota bacterium]